MWISRICVLMPFSSSRLRHADSMTIWNSRCSLPPLHSRTELTTEIGIGRWKELTANFLSSSLASGLALFFGINSKPVWWAKAAREARIWVWLYQGTVRAFIHPRSILPIAVFVVQVSMIARRSSILGSPANEQLDRPYPTYPSASLSRHVIRVGMARSCAILESNIKLVR